MRPEHEALLILVEPERTRREEKRLIRRMRGPFDWAAFVHLADAKLVAPFVLFQLRRHELLDLVPSAARERLRDHYETVASRNAILLHDLHAAGAALDKAGIEWVPLKGAALLHRGIYPDRGLRVLSDLDLLVRPVDAQRAWDLLRGHDYRKMVDNEPDARHLPPLVNGRGTVIELHRGIGNQVDLNIPVRFEAFRDEFLPSLAMHLQIHHARDAKLAVRGQIDLWFLNGALRAQGLPTVPVFENRRELIRSLRVRNRYDEVFFTRPGGWVRLLFPSREEMLRRHGGAAAGAGLYRLYGRRLMGLRAQLPTVRKSVAGYLESMRGR